MWLLEDAQGHLYIAAGFSHHLFVWLLEGVHPARRREGGSATIYLCGYWKVLAAAMLLELGSATYLFVWLLEEGRPRSRRRNGFSHHFFVWLLEVRRLLCQRQGMVSHP